MKKLLLLSILIFQTGCVVSMGDGSGTGLEPTPPPVHEEMRTPNLVKLIASDIEDPVEETTFGQLRYLVAPNRRLLLSYTSFVNHVGLITISGSRRIYLELNLQNVTESATAIANLKVCPVLAQWALRSNWFRSGPRTNWKSPGGDIDTTGCVSGKLQKTEESAPVGTPAPGPTPTPTPVPEPTGSIYFDVTDWYLNYPKGRGTNFGLVLTSGASIEVLGDQSGARSPRLYWHEKGI
jgi:hypothetical protein